jgi:DNA polymerase-3 subunit delta
MPQASLSSVRQQIETGQVGPLYVLQGEDEIEKIALAHLFEELIDEGLRAFNVDRIHAGEVTSGDKLAARVSSVLSAVRTLPMMAPRRVVLVFQADALLVPKRESAAATKAIDELERLLTDPEPQATLVFIVGSMDKRSRIYRLLARQATLVECGIVETKTDAERWIRNRVAAAGASVDPRGAGLLAERCGTDIARLRNDVERLLLYTLGQKTITLEDVKQIAGPAALQDDWALTNAIEAGDTASALRQLALTLDEGSPPEKILGQLGWLVRARLARSARALRSAVEALFRTDLDMKRSVGETRVLLERLVVELAAGQRQPAVRPPSTSRPGGS